jgi:hypothetical protein
MRTARRDILPTQIQTVHAVSGLRGRSLSSLAR